MYPSLLSKEIVSQNLSSLWYPNDKSGFLYERHKALTDTLSCEVEETARGEYELDLTYPLQSDFASDIKVFDFIKVEVRKNNPQLFEIYKVKRQMDGTLQVKAWHISYWLNYALAKTTGTEAYPSLSDYYAYLKPDLEYPCNMFIVEAEYSESINTTEISSVRQALINAAEKVGAYCKFTDNMVIKINEETPHKNVVVKYGKNLLDLTNDVDISDMITGYSPYWVDPDIKSTTKYEAAKIDTLNLIYDKLKLYHLNRDFDTKPTEAEVKKVMQPELRKIQRAIDDIQTLSLTLYELPDEPIMLYDTIDIISSVNLDQKVRLPVTRVVFDVLQQKNTEVDVGSVKRNLADLIKQGR